MEIPALFASAAGDGFPQILRAGENESFPAEGVPACRLDAVPLPKTESRQPAVVADWDSLTRRRFGEKVLKNMAIRGRDVWFMTWIRDADDVMDAFNTTADSVLAPLHGIDSRGDLEDICSVSDGVVPTVYASCGKAVSKRFPKRIADALAEAESAGFHRTCVLDTDGSVSGYEWETIRENHPGCVPFVSRPEILPPVFGKVISPFRFRGFPRRTFSPLPALPPGFPGRWNGEGCFRTIPPRR